jgi:hypothetical protein
MIMKKLLLFLTLSCVFATGYSQNTTIGDVEKDRLPENNPKSSNSILLIPFDPKLYLSEIDKKIGTENNMTFEQIRSAFRKGLDRQLLGQIKTRYTTYSMLADSEETHQDLALIYKSIGYKYELIPGVNQPGAKKTTGSPKVKEGQLAVEMNYDKRYMNAVVKNPNLLEYLTKKYKAGVFVFINELDLKNNMEGPIDLESNSFPREATVHFTVFDKDGKEILSGISTTPMSPKINDPRAIVSTTLAAVAKDISSRLSAKLIAIAAKAKPASQK